MMSVKRHLTSLLIVFLAVAGIAAHANPDFDVLVRKNINLAAINPEGALSGALSDLSTVFGNYQPSLPDQSQLVSPLEVGGTYDHPVLRMSLKKCIASFCQNVDFDGEVSFFEVQGQCQRNFVIETDLKKSGSLIRDSYDRFEVNLCFNPTEPGRARLTVTAQAHRAGRYQTGLIQKLVLRFLKMQTAPILLAFEKSLNDGGAQVASAD